MIKILRNTTISDIVISDTGITIQPGVGNQYTIPPIDYVLWAESADITSFVNSGDILVTDGTSELSSTDGLDFIRYPDNAKNQRFDGDTLRSNGFPDNISTQAAIEFAKTTVSGKMQDFEFTTTGNTQNKWVNISHPANSSDIVPFIALWSGSVIGFSYINQNDDSSVDLEFYVNGSLTYTWEIRNKRYAYKTDETGLFTVTQGDRLSIFAKKITGASIVNPSGISGEVMAVVSTIGSADGGTQTGV